MSETPDDIYDLKDNAVAPLFIEQTPSAVAMLDTANAEAPPVLAQAGEGRNPRWINPIPHLTAHAMTWILVGLLLCAGGLWAFRAGMKLRREVWQSTRSIRFLDDIYNGYQWGCQTLRSSERFAHLDDHADALAGQAPAVLRKINRSDLLGRSSASFRRLTNRELIDGIVHYCDERVLQFPEGDYDLDYPPLRLAVMTLWARHVQRGDPMMDEFPREHVMDTPRRQVEDVAEPMLLFNAYCTAIAAVTMFFLVWLWVWRGSRTRDLLPAVGGPRWRWSVPHGMVAFIVATAGFWYAITRLAALPPQPTPTVSVEEIQTHDNVALLKLLLNTQNQNTQWHIDWGATEFYGRSTPSQGANASRDDQTPTTELGPIAAQGTIHFRVVAQGDAGVTTTDDFSFTNDGNTLEIHSPTYGGAVWPTLWVWLRLLALFAIMVVSARLLPPLHRGWACGAVAALLVWFNPMVILVSNAWPQWDAWVLPAFLVPALLASLEWWLLAGFVLGVGIMFKGQVALGGPILLLWPLFGGKFGAFTRAAVGVALGAALVTAPWILQSAASVHWIESVMVAAAIALALSFLRPQLNKASTRWIRDPITGRLPGNALIAGDAFRLVSGPAVDIALTALAVAGMTLATWIIFHGVRDAAAASAWPKLLLLLVIAAPWLLPRRSTLYWLLATLAAAFWVSTLLFPCSWSWLTLGFEYGSTKHDQMQMSVRSLANLPTILARSYNWDIHDAMGTLSLTFSTPGPWRVGRLFTLPALNWDWSEPLDVKQAMTWLYAICLVISSAAASVHSRRRDPKFLAALIMPWAIFPVVMCQMGDRYLIWIAAFSAVMVAISVGMTFLHVIVSLLASGMLLNHLLSYDEKRWPSMAKFLEPTFPGVAWLTLMIAAIFLVSACVPSRLNDTT
jgi:hypothetical protein